MKKKIYPKCSERFRKTVFEFTWLLELSKQIVGMEHFQNTSGGMVFARIKKVSKVTMSIDLIDLMIYITLSYTRYIHLTNTFTFTIHIHIKHNKYQTTRKEHYRTIRCNLTQEFLHGADARLLEK